VKAADHRAIRDRVNPPARAWREYLSRPLCTCTNLTHLLWGARYYEPCVCAFLEYCPTHHRVTHVGTHD